MKTKVLSFLYKHIAKPLFFKIDPEIVHTQMVKNGILLGRHGITKAGTQALFSYQNKMLECIVDGINFKNPVGLSAGFDYNADLTQILPAVGFGFATLGTITNQPYEGNPKPMLGRLPKSRSLLVNKGFKNDGADAIIKKLTGLEFEIPIGISIGRTNSHNKMTQKESVEDICETFRKFEDSTVKHAYYELNISCPNLFGNVSFYPSKNLEDLLTAVDVLGVKKPIWVKMPIEKSDKETLVMLEVISKHSPTAVIFGNLQKDRKDQALLPEEVAKFSVGNFSGKPTFKRSNELISLTHKNYRDRFTIIGTGGIFSVKDAKEKLNRGAKLVQLITGMIFEGPQLIGEINRGLTHDR